jgi:diacylglycerol kinase (ATP)
MTQQAVAEGVDLVIGAGGDGTVRIVADGLAHTGTPMGLIPAGTANLLAPNLDLPLEEGPAIEVAPRRPHPHHRPGQNHCRWSTTRTLRRDGRVGVDAMIMDETDDNLKDKVGSTAYFVAAGKALGGCPYRWGCS